MLYNIDCLANFLREIACILTEVVIFLHILCRDIAFQTIVPIISSCPHDFKYSSINFTSCFFYKKAPHIIQIQLTFLLYIVIYKEYASNFDRMKFDTEVKFKSRGAQA